MLVGAGLLPSQTSLVGQNPPASTHAQPAEAVWNKGEKMGLGARQTSKWVELEQITEPLADSVFLCMKWVGEQEIGLAPTSYI